jgi:soluble lytic murein transglycosylase-like protein
MRIQMLLAAVFCMLWPVGHSRADVAKLECPVCPDYTQQIDGMAAKVEALQQKVDNLEVRETYFKILLEKERYLERVPPTMAWIYAQLVVRYSKEYGNDIDDVLSIIFVESGYTDKKHGYGQFAHSEMGAEGAMQIMPFWKKDKVCGTPEGNDNYYNLETNIRSGNCILAQYRKRFSNNFVLAALAYNKGPELVERELRQGIDPSNGYDYRILRELRRLKRWQLPLTPPVPTAQVVALK